MTEFVLGGGCFWCLDAVFRRIKGVTKIESGYAGGSVASPTYDQVSTGTTGHAEVIRIQFDEEIVPTDTVLDIFFSSITLPRLTAKAQTSDRSIVRLCCSAEQNKRSSLKQLSCVRRLSGMSYW